MLGGILRPLWKLNLRFHYRADLWCVLEKAVKDVDASVGEYTRWSAASDFLHRIGFRGEMQKDNECVLSCCSVCVTLPCFDVPLFLSPPQKPGPSAATLFCSR